VLQQRFVSEGPLNGHSVGNLLIAAVWNRLGDHVACLDLVGELLGAQGRVLPMAAVPLHITADVDDGNGGTRVVHGQAQAAVAAGVSRVALDPMTRRPARKRSAPSPMPTGSSSGRVPGSPASFRICWSRVSAG